VCRRQTQQEDGRSAAAALLATILRDCALPRFAALVAAVGVRLLALLRAGEAERVRVAACGALCAAVARASAAADAAPAVRREVAALLSKAVPSLLAEVNAPERAGAALTEACLRLVHVVAAGGCASVLRPHAEAAEAAAAAVLVARGGSVWASAVLAALPRVAGEPAAWSAYARRVLLAAHAALDVALRGVEPPAAGAAARGALVAPGEPPARTLDAGGGDPTAFTAAQRAGAWLGVAAALLESPFPTPVPFPTVPVFLLIARVLAADGRPASAHAGAAPAPVSPAVLLALPALHTSALALLKAALRSARRAGMLQVATPTAEVLCTALRCGAATAVTLRGSDAGASAPVPTCPALRASLYSATACFLHTMGGSFAAALAPELVAAAARDLAVPHDAPHAALSELGAPRAGGKKRRQDAADLDELNALAAARPAGAAGAPSSLAVDGAASAAGAAVRTAALRALDALCTVGGGVLAERSRADLDAAVAAAAASAAAPGVMEARCAASAAERSAAYACLLASVLAPRPRRAPHLPLALHLFRRGADEPGTAEVCGRALLALEAIIHPVAPPKAQPRDMAEPSQPERDDARFPGQVLSFGGQSNGMPAAAAFGSVPPSAAAPTFAAFAQTGVVPSAPRAAPAPARPAPAAHALPASLASAAGAGGQAAMHVSVPQLATARTDAQAARAPVAAVPPAVQRSHAPRPPVAAAGAARAQQAPLALGSDSEGSLPDIVSGDDEASSGEEEK
jgi:hypothetical protein